MCPAVFAMLRYLGFEPCEPPLYLSNAQQGLSPTKLSKLGFVGGSNPNLSSQMVCLVPQTALPQLCLLQQFEGLFSRKRRLRTPPELMSAVTLHCMKLLLVTQNCCISRYLELVHNNLLHLSEDCKQFTQELLIEIYSQSRDKHATLYAVL